MEDENLVNFSDWEKLDLRAAKILEVEDIEGADKLYKLKLDAGSELGERTICAGLKEHYSKEDLQGRMIIYFSNLKPRKMKGIESQGMLLASVSDSTTSPTSAPEEKGANKKEKVILTSPGENSEPGMRIG